MRWFTERLVMVMTASFLVLAVAQAEPSTLLVAGVAAVAVSLLVGSHYAVLAVGSRSITVGKRAREHRESLSSMSEPQHPDTAGRPRTRAPSQSPAVA